eukprot:2190255-Rhodomonas_salina.1
MAGKHSETLGYGLLLWSLIYSPTYPNSWLLRSKRKPDLWTYDSQTLYFVPSRKNLANPTTTPKPAATLRQPRIVSQDTSGPDTGQFQMAAQVADAIQGL